MIDFLLSKHPAAVHILKSCIVKVVPMINVDGVIEGFYRIGLNGCDLNRIWARPDPVFHPVVTATKQLLRQLVGERPIAAYIDFHGHSRLNGTFLFGCPNPDDPELRDSEKHLPRMLAFLSDTFSWGHCVFSCPQGRRGASRIVFRREMGLVQSFTLETSFGGVSDGPRAGVLYDEIIWKEIGAKCGEALYHLLIGEESPLSNYVDRELELMNPQMDSGDEEKEEKTVEVVELGRLEDIRAPRMGKLGRTATSGQLWWMAPPKTYLSASSRVISAEPPSCVTPVWMQMHFSPQ
jgi:hypothetical protein